MPENLKKLAEKYITPFKGEPLARVSDKSNWHITLAFCGYIENNVLDNLEKLTQAISEETKNLELFNLKCRL